MKPLQFPLVRITIFFIIGIVTAYYTLPTLFFAISVLIVGICGFILSCYFNKFFGFFCFVVSFSFGLSIQIFHSNFFRDNHYIKQIGINNRPHLLEIILTEKLKYTSKNSRYVAKVIRFDNKPSYGKIIFNVKKNHVFYAFDIGSILKIKSLVYKIRRIDNPNQFDYGKYLESQQIYSQVYTNLKEIKIGTTKYKNLWFYTANFRNKIINNLKKNGFSKNELAVIVALILGQQQDISHDILQEYQFAGAIHILSVSGLHVGFIMIFIGFILKPLPVNKKNNFIKLLITLLSIWIFGIIAGLAPSILRSVVMFSFVAIGKYKLRHINFYHTLMVSAFLILLFKPSFLFDVGFQLSYISLFFIVWLQPLFEKIWTPKNKIIDYIWKILTVSFAAQIGAFPLSIYYFHQFPGLFFITNIIVLPIIGFIMAFGLVIMVFAYFDIVPLIPMKILELSIFYLNQVIRYIASIEQFVIQNISLNGYMLWTLYLMIIAIIICCNKPNFNKIIFGLISIVVFQSTFILTHYFYQTDKELIIFNINKNTILSERIGEKANIYGNDSLLKNIEKNINLKSYLVGNFTTVQSKKLLSNLLYFKNNKILIIDKIAFYPTKIFPDILVITQSPKLNLDRLLKNCHPKIVIADGSNFKSYIKIWNATCKQNKVRFHSTTDSGFYKL